MRRRNRPGRTLPPGGDPQLGQVDAAEEIDEPLQGTNNSRRLQAGPSLSRRVRSSSAPVTTRPDARNASSAAERLIAPSRGTFGNSSSGRFFRAKSPCRSSHAPRQ